ncbi:hypothetical protein [Streptomyces sp. NPDC053755]|uniref:hypothetical protein n=1 Tax=Streptomyces sp. NPDC053755 TaxID=3155815 RepID=UPI003418F84D
MSDPRNPNDHHGPRFDAPVSHAQFAWGNQSVTQNQQNVGGHGAVAPGFEALAELVTELLRQLPQAGLADRDREDAEAAADEVLATITRPDAPEPGRVRRAVAALKGALAPVATGVVAGTAVGAQEWARAAIEGLTGLV